MVLQFLDETVSFSYFSIDKGMNVFAATSYIKLVLV